MERILALEKVAAGYDPKKDRLVALRPFTAAGQAIGHGEALELNDIEACQTLIRVEFVKLIPGGRSVPLVRVKPAVEPDAPVQEAVKAALRGRTKAPVKAPKKVAKKGR